MFAEIIRSNKKVRAAFDEHAFAGFWWKVILFLHGKPVTANADSGRMLQVVANGFYFYAILYRLVGLFIAGLLVCYGFLANSEDLHMFALLAGVVLGYLWLVSSIGFRGAQLLKKQNASSMNLLIIFMVLLTWFLVAACYLISFTI